MTRKCGDPCDWPGCPETKVLLRVNEKEKIGMFMCRPHASRLVDTNWWDDESVPAAIVATLLAS